MAGTPLERPVHGSLSRGSNRERDIQNLERVQAARELKPPPQRAMPERNVAAQADARRALR